MNTNASSHSFSRAVAFSLLLSLGTAAPLRAQKITAGSGGFTTGATWVGGVAPASGDAWTVQPGHTVTASTTLGGSGAQTGTVRGTLSSTSYFSFSSIGGGYALHIDGGQASFSRIYTNSTLANSTGRITLSAGSLTIGNRLVLTNTNAATTAINSFTQSGGTLDLTAATNGFDLWGADAGDRARFHIIGNAGVFNATGRSLRLYNTTAGFEQSAAAISFTFGSAAGMDALTTVQSANLVLGNNPVTLDFSAIDRRVHAGSFSTDLFRWTGTLTGSPGALVTLGLGSGESASLVLDTAAKTLRVQYTLAAPAEDSVVLLDNNFESVVLQNYSGASGAPFGVEETQGNATGAATVTVAAATGVDGSRGAEAADLGVRTRTTRDIRGQTYSYSLSFLYSPASATATGTFVGAGWVLPAGADGVNNWSSGGADKLFIGLRRTNATIQAVRLVQAANFSVAESPIPGGADDIVTSTLTVGHWYELSFRLRFDHDAAAPADSTVTLEGLTLTDRGSDGNENGAPILQLATATFQPAFGANLDSDPNAYAALFANRDRGGRRFDLLRITTGSGGEPPPPPITDIDPRDIPTLPDPVTVAQFNLPPQDANGWTMLTPSADSLLVYVDPVNGNDSTGIFYLPSDPAIGPDPQHPVGPILARRTLTSAYALLREDQPDWMLLKAGGVWTGESLPTRRGRSPAERAVVTSYGSGPRPELRTGTLRALAATGMSNIILQGIRFWAHTRDTDGPYFVDHTGSGGMNIYTRDSADVRVVRDILIEDCVFRAYATNVINGGIGTEGTNSPVLRFVIRRSFISGNYTTPGGGHSQGLFYNGYGHPTAPSLLIQESVFDHNGWRVQATPANADEIGRATIYNHNIYFSTARGVLFDRSMFLRSSSIGTKWTGNYGPDSSGDIVIQNCLYLDGEVGISMGGNDPGALRFRNIRIRDNVFTDIGRTRPTNRDLSWGINMVDWDLGSVTGNLIIHQRNTGISNTYGISADAQTQQRDVYVANNIIANLRSGTGQALIILRDGANTTNVLAENNTVQSPTATPLISHTPGGYAVRGSNRYFSAATVNNRFRVNSTNTNIDTWIATTGDTGAVFADPAFPDPTRSLATYAAHLGVGNSIEDFIAAVYGQSKANWNPALSTAAVNDWLRAGFYPAASDRFNTWIAAQALPPAADTTPLGVNNESGASNLLAYALDVNPATPDFQIHLPFGEATPGHFSLITRERSDDPGLSLSLEASDDLLEWLPVDSERFIEDSPAPGVNQVRYRVALADLQNLLFLRLRVRLE